MTVENTRAKVDGGYAVGFGRPRRSISSKKGQSGNPKGKRAKAKISAADVEALLNEPVSVRQDGAARQMSAFEVGLRKRLARALNGDMDAAVDSLQRAESTFVSGGIVSIA